MGMTLFGDFVFWATFVVKMSLATMNALKPQLNIGLPRRIFGSTKINNTCFLKISGLNFSFISLC